MQYLEETRDLFSVDIDKYTLAHCISADFALGAGIAINFNNLFNLRYILKNIFYNYGVEYYRNNHNGYCIYISECKVLNLVTKQFYYNKPTYLSMSNALRDMKRIALLNNINYIAMPLIGCGLDKLQWPKVKQLIAQIFNDTNIEILVCKYN